MVNVNVNVKVPENIEATVINQLMHKVKKAFGYVESGPTPLLREWKEVQKRKNEVLQKVHDHLDVRKQIRDLKNIPVADLVGSTANYATDENIRKIVDSLQAKAKKYEISEQTRLSDGSHI